jgi:quinol monooxygenase YgiN
MIRIVKMTFRPEEVEKFLTIFDDSSKLIRAFDGCLHLELLRDIKNTNIFFTYSLWESDDHLQAYRNSELFKKVWADTSALFSEKAAAWSVLQERVIE